MHRITSKVGATLKGKDLLPEGQFLSFKSSPYGKQATHFVLMPLYCKHFLKNVTHMRNVRNERYAYEHWVHLVVHYENTPI